MTTPEPIRPWEPRPPAVWAWLVFTLAALALCWPMFAGQFLAGDDQLLAGYAFREFGATYFKEHGRIPEWNPFLFGGMPFIAAMHGDIFYPTAWLRWIVSTEFGMSIGFFTHLIIAGGAMYALLRGLGLAWTAAVVGGVGYELSGIVASMVRPGHDGKLFVAALAPLAFLALFRGIRDGRLGGHGAFALLIGLCMLSPHYQMTYYLLVACGLFTLWLVFADRERTRPKAVVPDLALAALAAALGIGIGMIQGLPFLEYVPYSPRVDGGDSSGWEYATSYAMPINELWSTILPQFNGVFEQYWGDNFFKTHGEYLGALIVPFAVAGLAPARRRGLLLGFGIVATLFLLVSFGGHTPFYRLWYEVMPMMKKVRAAGMAFYLVALPVCVWAALGVDRIVRGDGAGKAFWGAFGVVGLVALLGAAGALQPVTEALADPRMLEVAMRNGSALQGGAIRLLLFVLVGGGIIWAVDRKRLGGAGAALALIAVVAADQWSVLRMYPQWIPAEQVAEGGDELTATILREQMPVRVYDPMGAGGAAQLYQGSWLMGQRVPTLFGYHGNESRFFDELFGGKNVWEQQFSPSLLDLYAVQFIVANQPIEQVITGYNPVLGPTAFPSTTGRRAEAGYLFRKATPARWVRVIPAAVKVPEAQIPPTVADPRFPRDQAVLVPDTSTIAGAQPPTDSLPAGTPVVATLSRWDAGEMTVDLTGADTRTTYLVVSENWYPGWTATVDGVEVPTHRGNFAMLTVPLPAGAKQVVLRYRTPGYGTGQTITMVSLIGSLGLVFAGRRRRRGSNG